MRRQVGIGLIILIFGSFWFFSRYRITGLEHLSLIPRDGSIASSESSAPAGGIIRVAAFHVTALDEATAPSDKHLKQLAEIIRRFDIVSLQGVRSRPDSRLARLLTYINAGGKDYDLATGPPQGSGRDKHQLCVCFNQSRVEIDRQGVYTVKDPDHLLEHPPLVTPFRVRGPAVDQAFTMTLISVQAAPENAAAETAALADVFRAVRRDGRTEDDVIMLGDFGVEEERLGRLRELADIEWVVSAASVGSAAEPPTENLLFARTPTAEFTGKAGVLDIIRQFNLSRDEAREISDHLPIWAEFSVWEGGQAARMASRADETER